MDYLNLMLRLGKLIVRDNPYLEIKKVVYEIELTLKALGKTCPLECKHKEEYNREQLTKILTDYQNFLREG